MHKSHKNYGLYVIEGTMDQKKFTRLVTEKLAVLTPESVEIICDGDDSLVIEVVSNSFKGVLLTQRISMVFELIADEIRELDMHVSIVPVTAEEKMEENNLLREE